MMKIDDRLLEPTCTERITRDINKIMQKFATTSFLFPLEDSILKYDTDIYGPFKWAELYDMYNDPTFRVGNIKTVVGNALKYNVELLGKAKVLPAEVKADLFGTQSPITHAVILVMEIPTDNYEDVLLDGNPIPYFRVFSAVNRNAYVGIVGLYEAAGVVKTVRKDISISVKNFTVIYNFTVSDMILE